MGRSARSSDFTALGDSLQAPEKSKKKAEVLHAFYDRITVAGPEIVVSG
jgi:hypothetical protein